MTFFFCQYLIFLQFGINSFHFLWVLPSFAKASRTFVIWSLFSFLAKCQNSISFLEKLFLSMPFPPLLCSLRVFQTLEKDSLLYAFRNFPPAYPSVALYMESHGTVKLFNCLVPPRSSVLSIEKFNDVPGNKYISHYRNRIFRYNPIDLLP